MSQLMSYAATQKLLDGLGSDNQKLVQDLVPSVLPLTTVQKVLANLLAERVSIRHLALILEAMHEAAGFTRNVRLISEHVRGRLALQICRSLQGADGLRRGRAAVAGMGSRNQPGDRHGRRSAQFRAGAVAHAGVRPGGAAAAGGRLGAGAWPAILTSVEARPFVRGLVERINATVAVISHNEVHPRCKLRMLEPI